MQKIIKLTSLFTLLVVTACVRQTREEDSARPTFPPNIQTPAQTYASKRFLADFEAPENFNYQLGEGDELNVSVWNHPDLTGKYLVGPDGRITIPLAGPVRVAGLTREEAASLIKKALLPYFTKIIVTVGVEQYKSNKITVLGRIGHPGIIHFDGPPTLLDVLAESGSMPMGTTSGTAAPIPLITCAVMRGRNRVAWVDLDRLLTGGDLSLNLRLRPNDVVFIPDNNELQIYVLGEVKNPGAYAMTPHMTFVDAIARAGGTTPDAAQWVIHLVRPNANIDQAINLRKMLPNPEENYRLQNGDIVYVPTSGLAKFGYFMSKISPGLFYFTAGQSLTGSL